MKHLVLIALLCALPAHAAERVLEFHSDIRIAADGQLTVTERILLVAEGNAIQRGILRDFPTVYRDEGRKISVPFAVRRVLRNGLPEPYAVERIANGVRIRIGRADVLLERGRHVYEISYRTARQVGFFDRHDELYWNVNGNGWTLGFDRISAEVQLPARVPARELKLEAWTGLQGARGRNYVTFARDGAAAFRSTRPFWPREGMTIVVAFPKGIVTPPSAGQRARWFVADHAGVLAGLGGLALLLAFLAWRWWLVGRDLFAKNRGSLFAGIGIALAAFAAMVWLEAPELFIGALALVMLLLLLAFSRRL